MHIIAHDLTAKLCSFHLVIAAHGGENTGNGNGHNAFRLQLLKKRFGSDPIKGGDLFAVIFKAAAYNSGLHGDSLQVFRPVHHRRNAPGCRGADAQNTDGRKVFALHDGVCALGGAKHRLADFRTVNAGFAENCPDGIKNTVIDVFAGVLLHGSDHIQVFIDENGVRVGTANVNTEFIHGRCLLCSVLQGECNRYLRRNTGVRQA